MLFWNNAIIVIFFIYGLAFYSMGLALLVESGRSSEFGFARSMRLLAAFGLLHGIHEWIDMLEQACDCLLNIYLPESLLWGRLILLITSFLALSAFGEDLLARYRNAPYNWRRWRITLGLLAFYSVSSVLVALVYDIDDTHWRMTMDVLARYTLAIPATLITCKALLQQRDLFIASELTRFASWLNWAIGALLLYGTFAQVFTTQTVAFPSTFINSALFSQVFGFPVQLLRGILACVIATAMIAVLRSLEVENERRIQRAEAQQLANERQQRQQLARLNQELREANAIRGEWVQRITATQEAERQRIARELHDDTGQVLTGLGLGLRGLEALITRNPNLASLRVSELAMMASTGLTGLRHLITDLRPPQLDDMGLEAALRFMQERTHEMHQVAVDFTHEGLPCDISQDIETVIFRIAQESINNTIKHANATKITMHLNCVDGLTLTITDNGKGFDVATVLHSNHHRMSWGLYGIQERASLINATLKIDSAPNQGTSVSIYWHPNESEKKLS